MRIAWFTEGGWSGNIPRDNPDMRNDSAWMCALGATHYPIGQLHYIQDTFDLGIVTIPKKNIDKLSKYPLLENLKRVCNKVAYMQEGPHWFFQDYPLEQQVWFYNTLAAMDLIFVHNSSDKKYYEGLVNKRCELMPTLMIEDLLKDLPTVDRKDVMIGGNFCNWYGGFDSYIVAQELDCNVYAPTMGRRAPLEEQMDRLTHLPYMQWIDWIRNLNNFKYGIHLMRTHAAGTFALNCAFLGIPCIGYRGLDTQELCHPELSVEFGDIKKAKELINKLKLDQDFYNECSMYAKQKYVELFSEEVFLTHKNNILL